MSDAHQKNPASVQHCRVRPACSLKAMGAQFHRLAMNLLLSAAVAGCATYGELYKAHEMPPMLAAAPNQNAQTLDLSKLSTGTPNTDLISKGDVLEITIAAGLGVKEVVPISVRVGDDGNATLPWVGPIAIAGMEMEDAESVIAQTYVQRQIYRMPVVTVALKRKRMNQVTVIGAVKSPGVKLLPVNSSDLLSALVAAGGLAEDAGTHVEIRNVIDRTEQGSDAIASSGPGQVSRTGYAQSVAVPKSVRVDLVSAASKGSNGYYIADGGVVLVEKRDPKAVHVLGLVRKPGRVEFPVSEDLYMLDALSLAGHTTNQVADKVYVIRQASNQAEPAVIQCSIRRAKRDQSHNLLLAPGDVVSVEHTPATVMMEVLNVIRFGVTASANPLFL